MRQAQEFGRRILVVDDNVDAASTLGRLLSMDGYEVSIAFDGLQAIELAERLKPDAVLLDIGLPTVNGYDVGSQIRAEPWGKDVILIAITAWGRAQDRESAVKAGFDGHFLKPFSSGEVLGFLAGCLAARHSRI